jgi:hypothetical protein
MIVANTQAYYVTELITTVKSFMTKASEIEANVLESKCVSEKMLRKC